MVSLPSSSTEARTIWGLDPVQLHTRYWAGQGVQVVRQGEPSQIVRQAELYLLTDPRSLPLFRLQGLMDVLNWIEPQVLFVRIHDTRERTYRERALTDTDGRFQKFERIYDTPDRLARVVLTPNQRIAQLWQRVPDTATGFRRLRRFTPKHERMTVSVDGDVFDRISDAEMAAFLNHLQKAWPRPDTTVPRARRHEALADSWVDPAARVDPQSRLIGPVWVGAGRSIEAGQSVIGPAVLWDRPQQRPAQEDIQWLMIEPSDPPEVAPEVRTTPAYEISKRIFDIVFSVMALLATCWIYPLVMLAIWLEDGRPFFFSHRRQTRGGREFGCVKFRSMRKDAEQIKQRLIAEGRNQADGAQFFMEDDPRILKIGRILRKYNLDELPQFFNVIRGDMSVVGPRPSPHKENQFCPPWREARLSVKPGITGLWQVRRTRQAGSDFQEWIKYDLDYVEQCSFWLDIKIVWWTIKQMVHKGTRS